MADGMPFDKEALANAEKAAAQLPNIRSFLIVCNGAVVSETYYGGTTAETRFDLRSITKSIVSVLVGIAIDRGMIGSVNDPIVATIPELAFQDDDARKAEITIKHLLTMTSGFQWQENAAWFFSDRLAAISDAWLRPLASPPGTRYNTDSASADLLTGLLARAANQDAQTFAIENLFAPLHITDFEWQQDPAVEVNPIVNYGYFWRSRKIGAMLHHYGMSYGGQFFLLVPGLSMVAVAHHDWHVSGEDAHRQKFGFTGRVFDPLVTVWADLS